MSLVKPPLGSPVRDHAGAPASWLPMLGPARTHASDVGDVADASGRGRAGVRHGGATWARAADGPCLAFDGATGYVECADFGAPAGSPLTISYWQYLAGPPAGGNSAFSLGQNNGAGDGRCQAHSPYADGTVYWDCNNPSSGRLTASYAGHYGRWTHVVLQAAGVADDYQAIYLDGRLVASRGSSVHSTADLVGSFVGAWNLAGSYFEGQIARFAVHLRLLAATEVARDHADPDWRFRGPRPARSARAYRPRSRPMQCLIGGHGLS